MDGRLALIGEDGESPQGQAALYAQPPQRLGEARIHGRPDHTPDGTAPPAGALWDGIGDGHRVHAWTCWST
jgi:hypothetical protein